MLFRPDANHGIIIINSNFVTVKLSIAICLRPVSGHTGIYTVYSRKTKKGRAEGEREREQEKEALTNL